MSRGKTFFASLRREWNFLLRNPWELAIVTWLPWLLMFVLVCVYGSGVMRRLPIAVVDEDRSTVSRELVRRLDAAPSVAVVARPESLHRALKLAQALDVYAVVTIPGGMTRDILRGTATVFVQYNASHFTAGNAISAQVASVVGAYGAQIRHAPPPVAVQSTTLFNPQRNTGFYLLAIFFPAVLHLAVAVAVTSALGRELHDRNAGAWPGSNSLFFAVAGKAALYVAVFTVYGVLTIALLSAIRGAGAAGSLLLLAIGHFMMDSAYAAIALLFVGLTREMGTALSLIGLFAGTSVAYSGATFPQQGAPAFVHFWNDLLPYVRYLELQVQQFYMASPASVSLEVVGVMVLFILIPGAIGLRLYGVALRTST
jgi:ABC-2 type transport system permease protein